MKIFNSNTKMQKRQNSSPSELHLIPFSNDAAVAKIAYIGSERYNSYYIIDTTFLSVVFLSEKHRLWVNDKHQRTAVIGALHHRTPEGTTAEWRPVKGGVGSWKREQQACYSLLCAYARTNFCRAQVLRFFVRAIQM